MFSILIVSLLAQAQSDTNLTCNVLSAEGYVYTPIVYTPYVVNPTVGGIGLYSARGHGDPDTALTVYDPRNPNVDLAPMIQLSTPYGHPTLVDNRGTVYGGTQLASDNGQAAFHHYADSSGAPTLDCSGNPGCYLNLVGDLPLYATDAGVPYGGRHGAVTISTKQRMDAGWLLGLENYGYLGSDKKFAVDWDGTIIWPSTQTVTTFEQCGYTLNLLQPNDPGVIVPGQHYYGAPYGSMRPDNMGTLFMCTADGWQPLATTLQFTAIEARVAALELSCGGGSP